MAYRGPALQHKLRKGTTGNDTGDSHVITIPRFIANQFSGCLLRLSISGNSIIMESGCKLNIVDVDEKTWGGYYGVRHHYEEYGKQKVIK